MSGNADCGGSGVAPVLENWDEMDDTDLNSKLKQLKTTTNPAKTTPQPSQPNHISSSATSSAPARNISGILARTPAAVNGSPSTTTDHHQPLVAGADNGDGAVGSAALLPTLLLKDEGYGGHYRPPGTAGLVEPIVKILRRPEHERTSPVVTDRPRQPVKTLQQREQEYAEARLRILGPAIPEKVSQLLQSPSPDTVSPAPASPATAAPASTNSNEPWWCNPHHHSQPPNYAGNSNGVNGPSIRRPPLLAHTPILTAAAAAAGGAGAAGNGIVRQPRGPDDLAGGFAFRR